MRSHFSLLRSSLPITRRGFVASSLTASLSAVMLLAGCGGSGGSGNSPDSYVSVTTGGNGSFNGSTIGPSPGSTYISSDAAFQIAWPDNAQPPPATFTASLIRYKEARGSADRDVSPQKITVSKVAGATAWNIARKDNFTLDTDGVYYLQITSPGQADQRAAYIVASGRSVPLGGGRSVSTGQTGSLNGVQISPTPGTVFLPKHTTFTVKWPAGTTPPPVFDVNLVRYKEARGGQARDVSTQKIDITAAGTNTWTVARQDNFDLDEGGVYYVEVTAAGSNSVRATYIVSLEQ